MSNHSLRSKPGPIMEYQEAIQGINALQAQEDNTILPKSRTQLFTHGYKTRRVIVWFHGYTSSPAQFTSLGQLCFQRGDNVLIPRAPYHGLKDRLTPQTRQLTAAKLARHADEVINLANGLGEAIIVGGLSMGGVIAAWLAQQRKDIATALMIAPAFGGRVIPTNLTHFVTRAFLILPNFFRWWDPIRMDFTAEPLHAYPRYSTRGLAGIFRLGMEVETLARQGEPACPNLWVVTNANDLAVNNELTGRITTFWRENAVQATHTYLFGVDLGLGHDLIDPLQPGQKVDKVYPVLLDMI